MGYRSKGGSRGYSGSSSRSSSSRSYSSAQAHQHVGQSKFGYTKTYSSQSGFKMKKS